MLVLSSCSILTYFGGVADFLPRALLLTRASCLEAGDFSAVNFFTTVGCFTVYGFLEVILRTGPVTDGAVEYVRDWSSLALLLLSGAFATFGLLDVGSVASVSRTGCFFCAGYWTISVIFRCPASANSFAFFGEAVREDGVERVRLFFFKWDFPDGQDWF